MFSHQSSLNPSRVYEEGTYHLLFVAKWHNAWSRCHPVHAESIHDPFVNWKCCRSTLTRLNVITVRVGFQVNMCVGFPPGLITIISCDNTEGWLLTGQDLGFRVFSVVTMFVFQSGHTLMSSRDKVRWDDGWTFLGSPTWSISICRVVTEWRLVRGDKWSTFDGGARRSWTVINSWISQLKSSTSFLYSYLSWIKWGNDRNVISFIWGDPIFHFISLWNEY
jgi:hypothetical protein